MGGDISQKISDPPTSTQMALLQSCGQIDEDCCHGLTDLKYLARKRVSSLSCWLLCLFALFFHLFFVALAG